MDICFRVSYFPFNVLLLAKVTTKQMNHQQVNKYGPLQTSGLHNDVVLACSSYRILYTWVTATNTTFTLIHFLSLRTPHLLLPPARQPLSPPPRPSIHIINFTPLSNPPYKVYYTFPSTTQSYTTHGIAGFRRITVLEG